MSTARAMPPGTTGPRLSFVKLIVADVDRAYAFYNRVLGVEQRARVRQYEGDDAIDEILSQPVGAASAPTLAIKRFVNRPAPPPGEVQIGFLVESVDATLAAAVAAGGAVLKPAEDQPQHGVRVAFFTDVEGHAVEIVELL